MYFIIGKVF